MRLRFGAIAFDARLRELTRDGAAVDLSPKAFALLQDLIDRRPEPISHEALYRKLWPDTFVEPGNLHNLVSEIRAALGDRDHGIIRTVHRVGYAFIAAAQEYEPRSFAIVIGETEIPLSPGENRIGRGPECAIAIEAPEVSRHHASLFVRDGAVTLHDLGSKNGTCVRGERVTAPVALAAGDEIVISTFVLRVVGGKALATTMTAGLVVSPLVILSEAKDPCLRGRCAFVCQGLRLNPGILRRLRGSG